MKKRYKIEITEFTTETQLKGKVWAAVKGNPDADYGYTPEIEKKVDVERVIYLQNSEELDLGAVIKAVNGL